MRIERAGEILDPERGERFEEDMFPVVVEACRMGAEALRILREIGEVANLPGFHVELSFRGVPEQEEQQNATRAAGLIRRVLLFCGMEEETEIEPDEDIDSSLRSE